MLYFTKSEKLNYSLTVEKQQLLRTTTKKQEINKSTFIMKKRDFH